MIICVAPHVLEEVLRNIVRFNVLSAGMSLLFKVLLEVVSFNELLSQLSHWHGHHLGDKSTFQKSQSILFRVTD